MVEEAPQGDARGGMHPHAKCRGWVLGAATARSGHYQRWAGRGGHVGEGGGRAGIDWATEDGGR